MTEPLVMAFKEPLEKAGYKVSLVFGNRLRIRNKRGFYHSLYAEESEFILVGGIPHIYKHPMDDPESWDEILARLELTNANII